jgi:hypothetical protein
MTGCHGNGLSLGENAANVFGLLSSDHGGFRRVNQQRRADQMREVRKNIFFMKHPMGLRDGLNAAGRQPFQAERDLLVGPGGGEPPELIDGGATGRRRQSHSNNC